jgi:hypothetical protein
MIKKLLSTKAKLSYIEIVLLISATIAISCLISETYSVDAQGIPRACCEKTKSGSTCQNVYDINECQSNFKKSPTGCENTDYCELGCCISSSTGICNENTPKISCPDAEFVKSKNCEIPNNACRKGCCILGSGAKFTTENNCKVESGFIGIPVNFSKEIKSEIKCIFSIKKSNIGACILNSESRNCMYTTLEECNTRLRISDKVNDNFFEGQFCSSVNSSCTKKHHQGCVDEKDDVYWIDSCGNPETIAKDCDFFHGTYCGKNNEDYICKDISCDTDTGNRKNGESWCKYDGTIGGGKDPVGSRHIRHICIMGEEKIEPCSDYRNEICVQKDTKTTEGDDFSQASCKVNNWRMCYSYNSIEDDSITKKCNENADCYLKDVDIADGFKFKVCLPNYPPGLNFETPTAEQVESGAKTKTESICSIATRTCTETWKWCLLTGWKCVANCDCHEQEFTTKMNEFCASLGDCGAWVNYEGVFTDGGYGLKAEKKWPPKLSQSEKNKIIKYAEYNPTQAPASPGNSNLENGNPENYMSIEGYEGILAGVSGALGTSLLAKILSSYSKNMTEIITETSPSSVNYAGYSSYSFSNIAKGISEKDVKLPNAMMFAAIGAAIGFAIGFMLQLSTTVSFIMAAVIGLIIFLLFFCKIKKFNVTFTCNQWERPTNGDCTACDKVEVPCTKYRCESLGQTCYLVNPGTTEQMCIDKCKDRQSIPEIKLWNGLNNSLPSQGYKYQEIENGVEIVKSNGEKCIAPYTKVNFGIKLAEDNDPYAECKFAECRIGTNAAEPFENMTISLGGRSSKMPYHMADIFLLSPETLRHQYNLTESQIKELSTVEYFIRCKGSAGENPVPFKIKACVDLGPDLMAPTILKTIPENNKYLKYGENSIFLSTYTNEPANCKWSYQNNAYDQMENEMNCDTDILGSTDYGWPCNTTFSTVNKTQVYIRCRDISENNNTMQESYVYNLFNSNQELVIKNMKPEMNEVVESGTEPVTLTLRLETSGGAESGKAICKWQGNSYGPDYFTETDSNFHSYEWNFATRGEYNIEFECEDIAGNIAKTSSHFSVAIDDFGPKITRAYYDGGLKIMTTENSECRYDFKKIFDFDNATAMSSNDIEHSSEWRIAKYNIQCVDDYGNKGGIMKISTYN